MSASKLFEESSYSSEANNPCLKEYILSLKCLSRTNYEQGACAIYFDNYKNCNQFWKKVITTRRQQGMSPYLPEPGDREAIKIEYLQNMEK